MTMTIQLKQELNVMEPQPQVIFICSVTTSTLSCPRLSLKMPMNLSISYPTACHAFTQNRFKDNFKEKANYKPVKG
jgi:hypothetical protein